MRNRDTDSGSIFSLADVWGLWLLLLFHEWPRHYHQNVVIEGDHEQVWSVMGITAQCGWTDEFICPMMQFTVLWKLATHWPCPVCNWFSDHHNWRRFVFYFRQGGFFLPSVCPYVCLSFLSVCLSDGNLLYKLLNGSLRKFCHRYTCEWERTY